MNAEESIVQQCTVPRFGSWTGADIGACRMFLSAVAAIDSQGKLEEANALGLKAVGIFEKALGAEHPNLAQCLQNRAMVLHEQVIDLPFR